MLPFFIPCACGPFCAVSGHRLLQHVPGAMASPGAWPQLWPQAGRACCSMACCGQQAALCCVARAGLCPCIPCCVIRAQAAAGGAVGLCRARVAGPSCRASSGRGSLSAYPCIFQIARGTPGRRPQPIALFLGGRPGAAAGFRGGWSKSDQFFPAPPRRHPDFAKPKCGFSRVPILTPSKKKRVVISSY